MQKRRNLQIGAHNDSSDLQVDGQFLNEFENKRGTAAHLNGIHLSQGLINPDHKHSNENVRKNSLRANHPPNALRQKHEELLSSSGIYHGQQWDHDKQSEAMNAIPNYLDEFLSQSTTAAHQRAPVS